MKTEEQKEREIIKLALEWLGDSLSGNHMVAMRAHNIHGLYMAACISDLAVERLDEVCAASRSLWLYTDLDKEAK